MNNALFLGFGMTQGFTESRINALKKKLKIDDVFMVAAQDEDEYRKISKGVLSFNKVIHGDYSEYPISEDALTDESLRLISEYDFEILHMLQRMGRRTERFVIRKNLYLRHLKYWVSFLKNNEIRYCFFHSVPHEGHDYCIYRLCEKMGIRTCMGNSLVEYEETRGEKWYYTEDLEFKSSWLDRVYEDIGGQCKEGQEVVLGEDQERLFGRLVSISEDSSQCRNRVGKEALIAGLRRSYWSGVRNPIKKPVYYGVARFLTYRLWKKYNAYAVYPDYHDKYIYVPLHYVPECTSVPEGGGMYGDQVLMIDILSQALPKGVCIYVKEHPSQIWSGRDPEFYDRLSQIKNVKLIRTDTSQYEIIDHCIAVSTLTGTAGYECQYFGKPFLMFGHYISRYLPGTIHVRSVEDCRDAVESILDGTMRKWSRRDIRVYLKFVDTIAINEKKCSDEEFVAYMEKVLRIENQ